MKIIYVRLLMLIILTTFVSCACGNNQDTLYPDGEGYSVAEVPTEQESIVLEEIGVTLILPDSWKGRYEVIEGIFEPYNSTMWEFCVKSIYDAQIPTEESGQALYRGTLFTIFQYTDCFMSEEEFEQSGIAGIGRYLFATENATYAVMYTTDMQYDQNNAEQKEEWTAMEQSIKDIRFVVEAENPYYCDDYSIILPQGWTIDSEGNEASMIFAEEKIATITVEENFEYRQNIESIVANWIGMRASILSEDFIETTDKETVFHKTIVSWEQSAAEEISGESSYPDEIHYFYISEDNFFIDIFLRNEEYVEDIENIVKSFHR